MLLGGPDEIDRQIAEHIAQAQRHEPVTVGCIPTSDRAAVPSVTRQCARCGREVWLSKRIAAILEPTARIVCVDCGDRR
jgi:DNA-directed RNA polymerase subunit RPC12/RpoP